MEAKVISILESIGLNKNEIKIYLDLISHDGSSALEISKRTKIHRSNTYDAIRKLIERGFIREIVDEKKRMFKAVEPEKILDYIKQQEQEVNAVMPFLKNLSCESNEGEGVSIARGIFAVRESLNGLLELRQPIEVFGASKSAIDTLGTGFMKEFHAERVRKKVSMKHIYSIDTIDRIHQLKKVKLLDVKCFPNKYCSIVTTNICGDTVLLLVFSSPVTSITIKNKEIADSYRQYFEVLWKQAKIV